MAATFPKATPLGFFQASHLNFKRMAPASLLYEEVRIESRLVRGGFFNWQYASNLLDDTYQRAVTTIVIGTGEQLVATGIPVPPGPLFDPADPTGATYLYTPSQAAYDAAAFAWSNGFYNGNPVTATLVVVSQTATKRVVKAVDAFNPAITYVTQTMELFDPRSIDSWITEMLANLDLVSLDSKPFSSFTSIYHPNSIGTAFGLSSFPGSVPYYPESGLVTEFEFAADGISYGDIHGIWGGDYFPERLGPPSGPGIPTESNVYDATYNVTVRGLLEPLATGLGYNRCLMHAAKVRHKIVGPVCLTLPGYQPQDNPNPPDTHSQGDLHDNFTFEVYHNIPPALDGTKATQTFSEAPLGLVVFDTPCPAQIVAAFLPGRKRQYWRWELWQDHPEFLQASAIIPSVCF